MDKNFFEKLDNAVKRNNSLLCVGLDPMPEQIPWRYRKVDSLTSMWNWNEAIIHATSDLVCAYKPNIAFYEAFGNAGMDLLRRTLLEIPPEIPVILDCKRGDIGSTQTANAQACFSLLGADAVTLSPYLGHESVAPFAQYPNRGLFVLCHTSNPSAGEFQQLEISDWRSLDREPNQPLYIHVARTATKWSPNVGLVVGATYPEALAAVRNAVPFTWFLVPGIGAQGGDLTATLNAGLREDRKGVIINVGRAISHADDHRLVALELRDQINSIRQNFKQSDRISPALVVPLPSLVADLQSLGAVKFGSFTLASGLQSPIYVDLRLLVSQPALLAAAAKEYARILKSLSCDRIAGVPYAALPIATAVAIESNTPLIYMRKEAKQHGLGKEIEGAWQAGERVVIIEDLITSGGSTLQTAEKLRAAGLIVEHAIVLIDRQQGGVEALAAVGITAHAVFTLSEMMAELVSAGRLEATKQAEILAWLQGTGLQAPKPQ